jgi:hypothetical protein
LLDHEYTQKGLSGRALKNGDAVRAGLLREVAARLDCEIVLALADVHETWSCEDDWGTFGRRRYGYRSRRDYDDDDDDDDDHGYKRAEDYELIELCSSDIELRHWVSPSDKHVRVISGEVMDDEICCTKPSVDLAPFKSEHEGYTGNAGNTVDRWYHRAAVLVWPRARTFAIQSKASAAWGIREIAKALARGKNDIAKERLAEMRAFWSTEARREKAPGFADHVLQVAAAIDDEQLATVLVDPIRIEHVGPKTAQRWSDLLVRYGVSWCSRVFERWTTRDAHSYDHASRTSWLVALPTLGEALCSRAGDHATELVRRIARAQWTWLNARLTDSIKPPLSGYRLDRLEEASRPIIALLATAALAGDDELRTTIIERLATENGYPISGALAVLRHGARHGTAAFGLGSLHDDCTRTLTTLVATRPRAPGDWSITARLGCKCELCIRLAKFLHAANQQQLEWPLAKDRRAHVHRQIDAHELPVNHVTRRVGSPHTLVLTKTRELFRRDVAERATWARDLAWLRDHAKAFADATARRRTKRRRARAGTSPAPT